MANNFTTVTEFILWGLTDDAELKVMLFVLFLVIYVTTLVGNVGMILLIHITPKLHTPMYFFLSCLSFLDACYSSIIVPKLLISFLKVRETISFSGCIAQHLFFGVFITTEGFLLSVMAYDRYIAIASPLLYNMIMSKRKCAALVTGSYIGELTNSLTHTVSLGRLSFCGPNVLGPFFCDIPPLLKLSCSDISMDEFFL